ncbi:DinB family protein [Actinopolymorpha sp. NPDC004070]|uniref:mycothiol transferase n=1 Tax=Actinopolymorpha sp. NPDC004070 TaxID=3154548 RepID=UPI0033BCBDEA
MSSSELLVDAFDRVRETVHQAVEGLSAEQLAYRVDSEANSIAWLVWHLTRVQDDHIADVAGTEQVWTADSWFERFDLPFEPSATGYGHSPKEVAQVRVDSADLLTGYYDAVHQATIAYVSGLGDDDLSRVVDEAWDPPVTLAVRLVSVLSDDLQHAGQAAFVRGVVERRS